MSLSESKKYDLVVIALPEMKVCAVLAQNMMLGIAERLAKSVCSDEGIGPLWTCGLFETGTYEVFSDLIKPGDNPPILDPSAN
jgi:hypothetical protein